MALNGGPLSHLASDSWPQTTFECGQDWQLSHMNSFAHFLPKRKRQEPAAWLGTSTEVCHACRACRIMRTSLTLKRISKDTLVIASPAGAAVAQGLGFRNVRTLDHGQEMTLGDGKLRIKATVGVSQHHHSQTAHFCQDRTVSAMKGSACYALPAEFKRVHNLLAWPSPWP